MQHISFCSHRHRRQTLSNQSAFSADRTSASEKVPLLVCFFFFSFCTEHTVVFFFFSPNPVKLFLRANQCLHTSGLQLINETLLILLLSAFFIGLFLLLLLISPRPLLFPLSLPPPLLLPAPSLPPLPKVSVAHLLPLQVVDKTVCTSHENGL